MTHQEVITVCELSMMHLAFMDRINYANSLHCYIPKPVGEMGSQESRAVSTNARCVIVPRMSVAHHYLGSRVTNTLLVGPFI